jgi:dihydropteroate synthase
MMVQALPAAETTLTFGTRPLLMGVLNVTPDSFSDGGRHVSPEAALAAGRRMALDGADIIDVGGESTRPGATPVDAAVEIGRVAPIIAALAATVPARLSIDTMKARVAAAALEAGASIVNDVKGFQAEPDIARIAAEHGATCVLMHYESHAPDADQPIRPRLRDWLARSIDIALKAGVRGDRIILDPGVGFGKTLAQNLDLITCAPWLKAEFGLPVLIGASRKRMIDAILGGRSVDQRLSATLALHVAAAMAGADVIRAHDVPDHADALRIVAALRTA